MSDAAEIERAKRRTIDILGKAAGEKVSTELALWLGAGSRSMREVRREGAASPRVPLILELERPKLPQPSSGQREGGEGGGNWYTRLKTAAADAPRGSASVRPSAASLLRHGRVIQARESFNRSAAPILDELQRVTRGASDARLEATRSGGPQGVERCWLNGAVRIHSAAEALAGVAASPSIRTIDLPRRLQKEIDVTGAVIGATAHRRTSSLTGQGVIIAIIDSEVAMMHPSLQGRVSQRMNRTREPWGWPDSHGTAVAGIAAADESTSYVGVAPGASIYNYKVLATRPDLDGDDFDGALAIQQALEDGAHVANCSWGAGIAGDGTGREAVACDTAWALGLIIVKSAGNRGPSTGTLTTPADAEGVIVVGASDRRGKGVADYSSRGPTGDGRSRPHLTAPGGSPSEGLMSCLVSGGFGDVTHGTSFAAPHVTGLVALMLERDPELSPDEVRNALCNACVSLAGASKDEQGAGLVRIS